MSIFFALGLHDRQPRRDALTVQRFSLTPAYLDYRQADGKPGPPAPAEIVAKELNDAKLEPGKTITF